MSDRQSPPPEDGIEQLPKDPQDRAEVEWLLAREQDPDAPPPNAALAHEHAELANLLETLPVGKPDRSWHADVLRLIDEEERGKGTAADAANAANAGAAAATEGPGRVEPTPSAAIEPRDAPPPPLPLRRRNTVRLSAAAGALLAAAAAIVLFLKLPRTSTPSPDGGNLVVVDAPPEVDAGQGLRLLADNRPVSRGENGDGVLLVDQKGTISLPTPFEGIGEVRIFRRGGIGGGSLAYMCGDGAQACQLTFDKELSLQFRPANSGDYVAIVIRGQSGLPLDATYDRFRRSQAQGKALMLPISAR